MYVCGWLGTFFQPVINFWYIHKAPYPQFSKVNLSRLYLNIPLLISPLLKGTLRPFETFKYPKTA